MPKRLPSRVVLKVAVVTVRCTWEGCRALGTASLFPAVNAPEAVAIELPHGWEFGSTRHDNPHTVRFFCPDHCETPEEAAAHLVPPGAYGR